MEDRSYRRRFRIFEGTASTVVDEKMIEILPFVFVNEQSANNLGLNRRTNAASRQAA